MIDPAIIKILAIEEAIKNTEEDGVLYEDELVIVYRENGEIFMRGKAIRIPMFNYPGKPTQ